MAMTFCEANPESRINTSRIKLKPEDLDGNNYLKSEFNRILETGNIRTLFQPIISLKDAYLLGYEALSRGPEDSFFESPYNLFNAAKVYGKVWELEYLCRFKALETTSKFDHDFTIFLNVDPNIMNSEKFNKGFTMEYLKEFNIDPKNIVFEITEKNAICDLTSFKKAIENYKDQNYKIAIDDAGSGHSGLKLITDIHPHYIKLDMSLIRDIDKNGLKHALIKTFYDFCHMSDIRLIAEGIETEDELNALIDIGINYGQGFLIQKPSPQACHDNNHIANLIKSRNVKRTTFYYNNSSEISVGDISRNSVCIKPYFLGNLVLEFFKSNPSILGLPVVDDNQMLAGLIMRDKFFAKLGTQYGFSLFAKRPVSLIMDKNPLSVNYEDPINIVSNLAMTRREENLYDYIIVEQDSKYHGIVTVKDLLLKTTELEISYAKHLNPLSGLPGNILIERRLKELLDSSLPFTVLYIDIDNFKVYNDVYGFENGDRMLEYLARIITLKASEESFYKHFTGHIGGDDFVIIIEGYDVENICQSILDSFHMGVKNFYNNTDLQRKYVIAKNRHGQEENFGIVALSIAGVSNKLRSYRDVYELGEYAGRIKKKCKEVWENYYHID